jgi:hypothetical protein
MRARSVLVSLFILTIIRENDWKSSGKLAKQTNLYGCYPAPPFRNAAANRLRCFRRTALDKALLHLHSTKAPGMFPRRSSIHPDSETEVAKKMTAK